ncbi:Os09g0572550, partial [Oryza sativa Japonica Group]
LCGGALVIVVVLRRLQLLGTRGRLGGGAGDGEVLERGDDVADGRAHGGVLLEAHGGDGEGLVEALGGVGAAEQGVGHVGEELLVLEARGGPLDEVLLIVRAGHVDGAAAGDDLEEDDAEAVDVGAGGELAGESVLGGAVAVGAHDAGGDVGLVADGADLGEAEVGEAGLEGGVEEDVGGLEVAVDDGGTSCVVQVLKAAGGALRDAHPSGPVQSRGARGQVKQVVLQGAAGHVLVHQDAVVAVGAVPQQRHQVWVLRQQAQHQHLHKELPVPLHPVPVQLLHRRLRHRPLDAQPPPVHRPEPSLPQQRLRPEPARRLRQLAVRERPRRHLPLADLQDLVRHALVPVSHCPFIYP